MTVTTTNQWPHHMLSLQLTLRYYSAVGMLGLSTNYKHVLCIFCTCLCIKKKNGEREKGTAVLIFLAICSPNLFVDFKSYQVARNFNIVYCHIFYKQRNKRKNIILSGVLQLHCHSLNKTEQEHR